MANRTPQRWMRGLLIGSTFLALLPGCSEQDATDLIGNNGASPVADATSSPARGNPNSQSGGAAPADQNQSPGQSDSATSTGTDNSGASIPPVDIQPLIDSITAQLSDRQIELGSSLSGSGADVLTSITKLNLCGFGSVRIVETRIFSGSTPTDFIGSDSETITDGVWKVIAASGQLTLEIRDGFVGLRQQGPVIRQFTLQVDANGALAAINGRSFRASDFSAQCQEGENTNRIASSAFQALANRKAFLNADTQTGELILCESGRYAMKLFDNGQLAILEGGLWSIGVTAERGTELKLVSDASFDPNGQTFTSTFGVVQNADGSVQIGDAATRLEAVTGDCDAAVASALR